MQTYANIVLLREVIRRCQQRSSPVLRPFETLSTENFGIVSARNIQSLDMSSKSLTYNSSPDLQAYYRHLHMIRPIDHTHRLRGIQRTQRVAATNSLLPCRRSTVSDVYRDNTSLLDWPYLSACPASSYGLAIWASMDVIVGLHRRGWLSSVHFTRCLFSWQLSLLRPALPCLGMSSSLTFSIDDHPVVRIRSR